jgi:hypothetical protein
MTPDNFYGWSFYWFPNILRGLNFGYGLWWYDRNGRTFVKGARFYGFSLSLGIVHIEFRRAAAYAVADKEALQ